jgi:hypothetical protein
MPPAASRVLDVRPGDEEAAEQVEEWLPEFQLTHDPELRERIILAYRRGPAGPARPARRPEPGSTDPGFARRIVDGSVLRVSGRSRR